MAGGEYLKIAVANIRRAVLDKQTDVKQLNDELTRRRNDLEHEIRDLDQDMHQKGALMNSDNLNDSMRQRKLRETQDDKRDIEQKRQEISLTHDEIKRQISTVEGQIRDLEGKARDLERVANQ